MKVLSKLAIITALISSQAYALPLGDEDKNQSNHSKSEKVATSEKDSTPYIHQPLATPHTMQELFSEIIPQDVFFNHIVSKLELTDMQNLAKCGILKNRDYKYSIYAYLRKIAQKEATEFVEISKILNMGDTTKDFYTSFMAGQNVKYFNILFKEDLVDPSQFKALKALLAPLPDCEILPSNLMAIKVLWDGFYYEGVSHRNYFQRVLAGKYFTPSDLNALKVEEFMPFYKQLVPFASLDSYDSDYFQPNKIFLSDAPENGWHLIDMMQTSNVVLQSLQKNNFSLDNFHNWIIPLVVSNIPANMINKGNKVQNLDLLCQAFAQNWDTNPSTEDEFVNQIKKYLEDNKPSSGE